MIRRHWSTRLEARARIVSTRILLRLIALYRLLLSPLIGQQCRFHPTCSVYAEDAILRFGPGRGSWLAFRRLLRCHPWHPGGLDPVEPAPSGGREH